MLVLATALKAGLLIGALLGIGLFLARASLLSSAHREWGGLIRLERAALALACLCAIGGAVVMILRLGGGFVPQIASLVLTSNVGMSLGLVLIGAGIIIMIGGRVAVLGALLVAAAFAVTGHVSDGAALWRIILAIHVLAASWWIGGLIILMTDRAQSPVQYAKLASRFGDQAVVAIVLLVVAGGGLTAYLTDFSLSGLLSPYGQVLLIKIGLVALVLGVALYNRTRLLPILRKGQARGVHLLRRNAGAELALLLGVAVVTAVLTTNYPPPTPRQNHGPMHSLYDGDHLLISGNAPAMGLLRPRI